MKDKAIIFFTRIPTIGKTKTRLTPFLSDKLCVDLQTAFIKDIYNTLKRLNIDIIVSYSDHGELTVLQEIIPNNHTFLKQSGADLGSKMNHACSTALKKYEKVVLIGSDVPLLTEQDINLAFMLLNNNDLVISPTYDGGYYLIGIKDKNDEIFKMKYSTNSVFEETIDKIKKIKKSYGVGNIQLDIDDCHDFLTLYEKLKANEELHCHYTRDFVYNFMKVSDIHVKKSVK